MAKRSRRARRQERRKPKREQTPSSPPPAPKEKPPEAQAETSSSASQDGLNFAQEYFYVYSEIRTFLIIGVLMFAVLIGLSFVI